jgi:hypothetical protein
LTTEQIKLDIDQLERTFFIHSLQPLATEELEQMQEKVKGLKEAFLGTCFIGSSVEELEEMRFKLAEISCNIIIALKERLHLNIVDDIRNLENVYRTA